MYKEMKKIQTGNWSLINLFQLNAYQKASISQVKRLLLKSETNTESGDKFPDFADLLFFLALKNVRVGGKFLGSVGRSETHIFFCLASL